MTSSSRRVRAGILCGVLAAALVPAIASPPSAQALSPGVAFSAEGQSTWQTNGVVWALGSSHGKVVAGGTFSRLRPPVGGAGAEQSTTGLAIFDGETGAPDSCQLPVALSNGETPSVRAITTSPDGDTVYVGGNFDRIDGVETTRVAAIDVESCTVEPFRVGGVSFFVHALAASDDTLYLAGEFTSVAGETRQRFAALDASTGALKPWRVDADAAGRGLGLSPDGSMVAIGGDFFNVNGTATHSIAVVDADSGDLVRAYSNNFIDSRSVTKHIYSGEDRFYVGNEGTGGGVFDGRLAISWSTLDQEWRDVCLGATQATLEHEGTLYSASHAHDCSSDGSQDGFQDGRRNFFNAQDAETAKLLGWDPRANDGINEGIGPRALTTVVGRTTGKTYLWAGGEFTVINGTEQQSLTRFGPDDGDPPPMVSQPVVRATSEGSIQVRFRSVVDPDDSELTYTIYRNGAPTPVWQTTSSSVWWKRPQLTFVDTDVVPGSSYTYRVRVSDTTSASALTAGVAAVAASPSATYASVVRSDQPSTYLDMEYYGRDPLWMQEVGATSSGSRRINGLLVKYPERPSDSPVPGDATGSVLFNGSSQFGWSDEFVPGPSTYSIETWVKTTTTRGGLLVGYGNGRPRTDTFAFRSSSSGKFDRLLYLENTGQVRFGAGSARETVRSSQTVNDGTWHHLVATQDQGGMALYIDGARAARAAATAGNAPMSYNGVWHYAAENLSGWPGKPTSTFFAGQLDEVAIYPSALPRSSVASHYRAAGGTITTTPRPTDTYGAAVYDADPELYWRLGESSGTAAADSSYTGNAPGTYQSEVTRSVTGIPAQSGTDGNRAVTTPGSSGGTIATQTALSPAQVFSTEVWFKTTTTRGGKIIGFENTATGSGSSYDKHLYMQNDGRLTFGIYSGQVTTISSPLAYNDGSWHHAVAGVGPSGQFLYVDGQQVATSTATNSQAGIGYWRLGGGNLTSWPHRPSSDYFAGSIDEAAVYAAALPLDEVRRHYALGAADTEAPAAPTDLRAEPGDGEVALAWTASTDDVAVTDYRIHRGTSAGFTLGAESLVGTSATTSFTDTPPASGTYYYRVVARDAAGNASEPSTEVSSAATLPDTTAPSVVDGVTASVVGAAVSLAWPASTDDVGVTGYRVYRGDTADVTPAGGTRVGEVSSRSFVDESVPLGTYYYRVEAFDAAGNVSALGAATRVEVGATTVVLPAVADARVHSNLATRTFGGDVQLASTGGNAPVWSLLRFDLPAAPAGTTLSGVEVDLRTSGDPSAGSADAFDLVVTGDAWSEGDVTWNTRPTLTGASLGTLRGATATNTPYRMVGDPSALADRVGSPVTLRLNGPDGSSDNLRLWSREAVVAYRPTLTLTFSPGGDTTAPSVPAATTTVEGDAVTLTWPASTDNVAVSGYTVYRGRTADFVADGSSKIADVSTTTYVDAGRGAGTWFYEVDAFDATGNRSAPSPTVPASIADVEAPTAPGSVQAEPAGTDQVTVTWTASTDDAGVADYRVHRGTTAGFDVSSDSLVGTSTSTSFTDTPPTGGTYYYRVVARDAASNESVPSDVAPVVLGDVDTVAPTVPSAVEASVAGGSVSLSWSASRDDVAVSGYRVYRGAAADFTVDAAHRVGTPSSPALVDVPVPAGTHFYKVEAVDESGNVSDASAAVRVEVTVTEVVVEPVADARVHSGLADRTFGGDRQLAATGGGGASLESFLRYELPEAPAGQTLSGVAVTARTSGDPTSGTVDRYEVHLVTGAWEESTVTWLDRPTEVVAKLADLTGLTAVDTPATSIGDPAVLRDLGGRSITLRIAGPSTSQDNLRLWSREGPSGYATALTLTYS